jgi:hypothetical protein
MDEKNIKKLAIVGYAHPSKNRAPYDNPDYDIWGMNQYPYRIPRATLWFEMHYSDILEIPEESYRIWLRNTTTPVIMQKESPEIPASLEYPLDEITAEYDPFFNCTVDYMLAMAIFSGKKHIELYGIHCLNEYEYEKKGIEYWLGVCRGKGIKFFLPDEADILCPVFYGYKEM